MKISSFKNKKYDLLIYTVEGDIDYQSLLGAVKEFYDSGPTRNALWDFSLASAWNLSSNDVETLAALEARFDPSRAGSKSAIVASDEMIQAMGQLFIFFGDAREIETDVRLFHSKAEALAWITS